VPSCGPHRLSAGIVAASALVLVVVLVIDSAANFDYDYEDEDDDEDDWRPVLFKPSFIASPTAPAEVIPQRT
jgi:hypothetical protein